MSVRPTDQEAVLERFSGLTQSFSTFSVCIKNLYQAEQKTPIKEKHATDHISRLTRVQSVNSTTKSASNRMRTHAEKNVVAFSQ